MANTNNFKPKTSYHFNKQDYEFINLLTKVGFVHILSSQVSFLSEAAGGGNSNHGFTFIDYGANDEKEKCAGLTLPEGWAIEGIWGNEKFTRVTFGVKH